MVRAEEAGEHPPSSARLKSRLFGNLSQVTASPQRSCFARQMNWRTSYCSRTENCTWSGAARLSLIHTSMHTHTHIHAMTRKIHVAMCTYTHIVQTPKTHIGGVVGGMADSFYVHNYNISSIAIAPLCPNSAYAKSLLFFHSWPIRGLCSK